MALTSTACHRGAAPFDRALDRAATEARAGNIDQARQSYREAFDAAKDHDQEIEARYRELLLIRSVETAAALIQLAHTYPDAARAPRCLLDAGRIYKRAGQTEAAQNAFYELLVRYPASASAGSGFQQILAELRRKDPSGHAERSFIAKNRAQLSARGEEVLFRDADALEQSDAGAAIFAYESLAQRYPLPEGRYADEALLRAARLRLSAGDAAGALAVTETIMAANEKSLMVGSYTRSGYAEAAFLRATILRDQMKDSGAAIRAFEQFPALFPKSRLRDDALHAAAELYLAEGRSEEACAAIRRLEQVDPGSRFRRVEATFCALEPRPSR